jgi:ribosomal protein L29
MSLPKYNDLKEIQSVEEIEQEIFVLQKSLLELRMKRATSQAVKPHLFIHTKRRIAQLKFKKNLLIQPGI